jgi:hypothetical protein
MVDVTEVDAQHTCDVISVVAEFMVDVTEVEALQSVRSNTMFTSYQYYHNSWCNAEGRSACQHGNV